MVETDLKHLSINVRGQDGLARLRSARLDSKYKEINPPPPFQMEIAFRIPR